MNINLDGLTEEELIALNAEIIQRIHMIRQYRAQMAMVSFKVGERVCFDTDDGRIIRGTVTRWNKKTVSIEADCGHRWRVSPTFLRRIELKDITPKTHPENHQLTLFPDQS